VHNEEVPGLLLGGQVLGLGLVPDSNTAINIIFWIIIIFIIILVLPGSKDPGVKNKE